MAADDDDDEPAGTTTNENNDNNSNNNKIKPESRSPKNDTTSREEEQSIEAKKALKELSALMGDGNKWGKSPESFQRALELLGEYPTLAIKRIDYSIGTSDWEAFTFGYPLHNIILAYKDIVSVDDLQFILDLYPKVLEKFDFLHFCCKIEGIPKHVIEFFINTYHHMHAPHDSEAAITKKSIDFDNKYPFALYFERICLETTSFCSTTTKDDDVHYWKEVYEVCDMLWIDDEDDFVDLAVEKECWPLVSYFVNKASESYWEQKDPDEAWKHKPPNGTLSVESIQIIDQLLLAKFPRKALELELSASRWNGTRHYLCPWIQNHSDLRLLYLHSCTEEEEEEEDLDFDDDQPIIIPPQFTDALFEALANNQSLEDFRMSGNFHASWNSFALLLQHAPTNMLTCNLSITPHQREEEDHHHQPMITPSSTTCCSIGNLRKLDLFRIKLDPKTFQELMRLLATLPCLIDLEMILDVQDYEEEDDDSSSSSSSSSDDDNDSQQAEGKKIRYSTEGITNGIIHLLEQGRIQHLTFGPGPLAVIPMCNLLKKNKSLEMFKGYFREQSSEEPGAFKQLLDVMKHDNRTLKKYGPCEFVLPSDNMDTSMGGLRQEFLFYTRLNRIDRTSVLACPEATVADLIDLLLKVRTMLADDLVTGILGLEVPYSFELLQQCPELWTTTGSSSQETVSRRAVKRKLSNG